MLSRRLGIDYRRPGVALYPRLLGPMPSRLRDRFRGRTAPSNGAPVAFASSPLVRRLFCITCGFCSSNSSNSRRNKNEVFGLRSDSRKYCHLYKSSNGGPKQESMAEGPQRDAGAEPGRDSITNIIITFMQTFSFSAHRTRFTVTSKYS